MKQYNEMFFFIILLPFINYLNIYSQSKSNQLIEVERYKSLRVKSVNLFEYSYTIEGEMKENGFLREQIYYDKEGRKTESKTYDGDKIYEKTKYVYDKNSIEIRYYWENVIGNKFKVVHFYNDQGFLIKSLQYNELSLANWKTEYIYNSIGQLIKEIHRYSGEYFYEYKYDMNGNLTEKTSSPWGGRNKEKTVYTYNDDNLIMEANTFDVEGDPIKTIVYKYLFYKN